MSMKQETQVWLTIAEEDFQLMSVMKREMNLRPAVLFAQQAVEKVLKGYICEVINEKPKKTHFIEQLIKTAKLDLKEIGSPKVEKLGVAYEWARYKDLSKVHFKKPSDIEELLIMAEKIYPWVLKKLKEH